MVDSPSFVALICILVSPPSVGLTLTPLFVRIMMREEIDKSFVDELV
jgi:hypothetical protein